jgi:hypothetical protein
MVLKKLLLLLLKPDSTPPARDINIAHATGDQQQAITTTHTSQIQHHL